MSRKAQQLNLSLAELTLPNNPVAKHAHKFNQAKIYRDKTAYRRQAKHAHKEPCIVSLTKGIMQGSSSPIVTSASYQ